MSRIAAKMQLTKGSVRIATVTAIPRILQQLGYDPDDVLQGTGFDSSLFDDPDNVITYTDRSRLIQHCVNKTGCQHFGLLIGQHTGASAMGLTGFLMLQSPDIATALYSLIRYSHLHVHGAVIYLEEDNGMAFLGYSIYQPHIEACEQIEDGAVAVAFNIMRKLGGSDWKPKEVNFSHQQPVDSDIYKNFFNAPLKFDAERNGVLFSAHWLKQPVIGADPELRHYLQKQIDELDSQYSGDFAEQVRRVMHAALLTQQATTQYIATLFSIHPRTLSRRLKSCGTSFQELADQSRFEIAQQLLENSTMPITQIATTLGYADASAFTRAFRRWSGITPATWRKQNNSTDH